MWLSLVNKNFLPCDVALASSIILSPECGTVITLAPFTGPIGNFSDCHQNLIDLTKQLPCHLLLGCSKESPSILYHHHQCTFGSDKHFELKVASSTFPMHLCIHLMKIQLEMQKYPGWDHWLDHHHQMLSVKQVLAGLMCSYFCQFARYQADQGFCKTAGKESIITISFLTTVVIFGTPG